MKYENVIVYIDPAYFFPDENDTLLEIADFIVISHNHPTRYSESIVRKLSDNDTIIIASQEPADFGSALLISIEQRKQMQRHLQNDA